jgi:uncharacterized protein (TIGR02145 family)
MKKLGLLLAIFCTLQANGQPFSISFSGTGLSTVKVQNLTSGVIVDVPAGDVLHLSTTTDIQDDNNLKSSGLKLYPNPMTDISTLEVLPPVVGNAIISVCDMTGKVLTQYNGYMENGTQEFSLSGIKNGLHLITVQGNGYQLSEKLLSNGKSNGKANIVKISNNIQAITEKKSIKDSKGVRATVDMAYNSGERLKYTSVSGNNKTVMTDIPTSDKTVTFTFTECKDGDNNHYPVVQINSQLWMAENLKTTSYNDGTAIPNKTIDENWAGAFTGTYCDYNNTPANSTTYGRLYNWMAVDNNAATKVASNGGKNVCPTSWHIPTGTEWTILTTFLGGESVAGSKLKETGTNHWASPNTGATNETGFTALPGGYRHEFGTYFDIGSGGYWWSSTDDYIAGAWFWYLGYYVNSVGSYHYNKHYGYSVRCVRD